MNIILSYGEACGERDLKVPANVWRAILDLTQERVGWSMFPIQAATLATKLRKVNR